MKKGWLALGLGLKPILGPSGFKMPKPFKAFKPFKSRFMRPLKAILDRARALMRFVEVIVSQLGGGSR
ncbi:hypothetical protein SLA2020_284190 [Shorea laevis]